MDRRSALKNLTMSLGYAVATPSIMSILSSCKEQTVLWNAKFLTKEEQKTVIVLVNIIIPASDVVGALDVNVTQFLDLMYKDIETETNQKLFKNGAAIFADKFHQKFGVSVMDGEKKEFEALLTEYFELSEEETKHLLWFQKTPMHKVSREKMESFNIDKFLLSVRYYAIFGYCTSEKVGEEVLSYDPIPGQYNGCIPVEEVGNAWSI